jgi:glycerol-3-phosphate cytidylyltransferase-like family protein
MTALPMSNGQHRNQNYTQCNYINDVTRLRVKGNKIMAMEKYELTYLRIGDNQGSRQRIDMTITEE